MPVFSAAPRGRVPVSRTLALAGLLVVLLLVAVVAVMATAPRPRSSGVGALPSPTTGSHSPADPSDPADPASPGAPTESNSPLATPQPGESPISPLHKSALPTSLPPEELTDYVWPLRKALISGRFAPREFGAFVVIDGEHIHDGLDLVTRCGDRIRAAHDGTVLYAGRNFDVYLGYRGKPEQIYARLEQRGRVDTLPIVVVIDDGNGYRSIYVHLSKANVEAGDQVSAGDVIGTEGKTGYATGCHLHYGLIRMDGGWQEVIPRLHQFGYPALVRERVNPLDVLPWDDPHAPKRLRDRAAEASPTPDAGEVSPSPAT